MKKIMIALIIGIFLISFSSALLEVKNTGKSTSPDGNANVYPSIEIVDWLDIPFISKTLAEMQLEKHTPNCGEDCYSEFDIRMYGEPRPLVDSVRFETIKEDGTRIEQPIISYKFLIQDGSTTVTTTQKYHDCQPSGRFNQYGEITDCILKTRELVTEEPIWKPYNGEDMNAGKYRIRLEGKKKAERTVDWIITTQGIEVEEWSSWTGSSLGIGLVGYWEFNDYNNTINSTKGNITKYQGTPTFVNTATGGCKTTSCIKVDQTPNNFALNMSSTDSIDDLYGLRMNKTSGNAFAFWFNMTTDGTIINDGGPAGDPGIFVAGVNYEFDLWTYAGGSYTVAKAGDTWHLFVMIKNQTGVCIFLDNVTIGCETIDHQATAAAAPKFVGDPIFGVTHHLAGQSVTYFDEMAIWARNFTLQDANLIWNNGVPLTYNQVLGAISNITLISPGNNNISNTPTFIFNCSVYISPGNYLINLSLYHNASGILKLNQTYTGGNNNSQWAVNNFPAETYNWTCRACDNAGDCANGNTRQFTRNLSIVTTYNYPADSATAFNYNNVFSCNASTFGGLNATNVSLYHNVTGASIAFNQTARVYGSFNSTTFSGVKFPTQQRFLWNCLGCNQFNECRFAGANRTIYISFFNGNLSYYNTTTYEIATESFGWNATNTEVDYVSNATLWYNGTYYYANIYGANYSTRSLDMPQVNSEINMTWKWLINNGTWNTSIQNQTIYNTSMYFCGVRPKLNFSYSDEVNLSSVNAVLNSFSLTYWFSNASNNISYSYSNTTATLNWLFCFEPNRTFFAQTDMAYSNGLFYPQRTYSNFSQFAQTNRTFYLLSTSDGMYVSFQIVNVYGQPLSGATVVVSKQSTGVIIGTKTTDSAGIATFFLNVNDAHSILVSKTGYVSTEQVITPTQSLYTIVMGGSSDITYNNTIAGLFWYKYPKNGILNSGRYTFGFNVSSSIGNMVGCMINLTNNTGTVINSSWTTGDYSCNVSTSWEIHSGDNLYGKLYVNLGEGYLLVENDAHWLDIESNVSSGRTLSNVISYLSDATNWIGEKPASMSYEDFYNTPDYKKYEFTKMVAFFLILAVILASLNIFSSFDVSQPGIFMFGFPILITLLSLPPLGITHYWEHPGFFFLYNATHSSALIDNFIVALYTWLMFLAYYFGVKWREG